MDQFQERLRNECLEANWQRTYKAGADPISARLCTDDLAKPRSKTCSEPHSRSWRRQHCHGLAAVKVKRAQKAPRSRVRRFVRFESCLGCFKY